MQFRNTVIVLILLALIGGYAYFVVRKQPADQVKKVYQGLEPAEVTKISLEYPDRKIVLVRSSATKWSLVQPIAAEADSAAADNLARVIVGCEIKKTVEESPENLAPFGLAKPKTVVTIDTKHKTGLPGIELGKNTPVGYSAYIKLTDKPAVLMTSSSFSAMMDKKVDDLRDHSLMSVKENDVTRLKLEPQGAPAIELIKEDRKWRIIAPAKYDADQSVVNGIVRALINGRVDEFINDKPEDPSQYGLDKPQLTVSVFTGKEGYRESLLFGQKEEGKDDLYVRRGEKAPVFAVHQFLLTDVAKTLLDLRDKTVIAVEPSQVDRVTIDSDLEHFELLRGADKKWQIALGGKVLPADSSAVEEFLHRLSSLKGKAIVADPDNDPQKFGLNKPSAEVRIFSRDKKQLGHLELAKIERRNEGSDAKSSPQRVDYYVSPAPAGPVYTLENYAYSELTPTVKHLQAKQQAQPPSNKMPGPAAANALPPAAKASFTPAPAAGSGK